MAASPATTAETGMHDRDTEAASRFDRGLLELRDYLLTFDEAALTRAVASLRAATQLSPGNADYRVALGFALDAGDEPEAALEALRQAIRVNPGDEEAEVFVLTLLTEAGQEAEALAGIEDLAARTDVDLDSLRRDLVDAEMPLDALSFLSNGFIHARNFIRSRLDDAMDKAERSRDPLSSSSDTDLEDCRERQAELEREVEAGKVPSEFRHLVPWVLRLGVGDDPCRAILIEELTQDERDEALQAFQPHAVAIHSWLDSFGEGSLSPEAAAFMYALLAAEEMRTQ